MVDDVPRILGGRYEVGELIGRGGMAEVHIGHDTRLGRTVAIKILRSDLARDPSFQARFRREAQAAASLNHPSIVAVYDTGEDVTTESGGAVAHVPFIVMEYVEGHTVRDILRDGAAVPIAEAIEITSGVLSALEYSHRAGIVHRDIKPANVMLTPTGAVKVMDFGIARAMADSAGTMTQTQAVIGTAQYLSPEQARGEPVDSRSDLYSTGCLLFELLTGRPPFIGDSPVAVAYQHAREVAPAPSIYASDIPETLDRVSLKALAKERDHRYRSASDFRHDLEAVLRGGPISAPAVGAAALAGGPAPAATGATEVMRPAAATQAIPPAAGATPWGPTGVGPNTDVEPEEDKPNRTWLIALLVAVGVLAIGAIVFALTRGGGPEPVLVPDVVGMSQEDAVTKIEDVGLAAKPVTEPSQDVEAGLVIRTDPAAQAEAEPGDEVTVYVSSGPDAVTMEDLSNQTQAQAEQWLKNEGFNGYQFVTENSPEVPEGHVTRTDPPAGDSVDPATARITVYVSDGKVTIPNLSDGSTTVAEATAALEKLGLLVKTTEEETSEVNAGVVIRQDQVGPVAQHSAVTLTISITPVVQDTQVPDVTGKTYSEAAAALGQEGLNATPGTDEYSDTVPAGQVIRTNPVAGTTMQVGDTVEVIVSRGPDPAAGDGGLVNP